MFFELRSWHKWCILWGLAFLVPLILILIYLPAFTGLQIQGELIQAVLIASLVTMLIIVSVIKKWIGLTIFIVVLGVYLLFIGFGGLIGGVNFAMVNPFDFSLIEKNQSWQLDDKSLTFFGTIAGSGFALSIVGGIMLYNKLMYGGY